MAERGGIDVPQLGDREGLGRQGEADVGVRQLGPQSFSGRSDDRPVVERGRRKVTGGVPRRVRGNARLGVGGHQREVGRGEDAAPGVPSGVAAGFQLLEVGDSGEVDLGGQVASRGRAEPFARSEGSAGQRPPSLERRLAPPPEQDIQAGPADLEDHREHLMAEPLVLAVACGRASLVAGPLVMAVACGRASLRLMFWHVRMILCHPEVFDY